MKRNPLARPQIALSLMVLVLYLATLLAFALLRESTVAFVVLTTILFAAGLLFGLNICQAIFASVSRALDNFGEHLSNNDLDGLFRDDSYEDDEIGNLFKNQVKVKEKLRQFLGTASEAAATLQEYARQLFGSSNSLNVLNEEIADKTGVANTNIADIEKNIDNTSMLLSDVMENVFIIASSTEEMSTTINTLASASGQASSGVEQVSQLVEQISSSIANVSDSAKDVSSSVDSIVTSVKEINISLNNINRNCERSINITSDAGSQARDTNDIINDLASSTRQIGKIVDVISKISNQTNMLALNAAIEAAGAGESGKGFAVVASEVKVLANQTAHATEEIRQQIENMQDNMSRAVSAVALINQVIQEINEISNTIGASVTEQYVTTGEISRAVVNSAEKVNHISEKIEQIAGNAQNAARNVFESSKGIKDIAVSAAEISTSSHEVARNAEKSSSSIYNLTMTFQEVSSGSKSISANIEHFTSTLAKYNELAEQLNQYAGNIAEASETLSFLSRN